MNATMHQASAAKPMTSEMMLTYLAHEHHSRAIGRDGAITAGNRHEALLENRFLFINWRR